MENSNVSSAIPPRDKNSTITLVLIGVIIIICLGFIVVVIGYVGLTTGTNNPSNNNNQVTNTTNTDSLVATDPSITILTPELDSLVNGKIFVKVSATYHFSNLKVEIFDNEENRLGTSSVSISSVSDAPNAWESNLDIIESPRTSTGKIVVSSVNPELSEVVSVKFEIYSDTPSNLIVNAPLENQVMLSSDIKIIGKAKGLFEGNLQIRLKDSTNAVIYLGFITINDQYEFFRSFSEDVNVDNLNEAIGETGTWEFYYQSAKDGSEVILQSITVRFL